MESVSDFLRYKEEIKSTLHCEDQEKLRKKLALLQKEYLRTAQRLQRAERLEAARKHVRSKTSEKNQQVQEEPVVSSCLTGDTSGGAHGTQFQKGPSDAENPRPLIRFQLPADTSSPSTPNINQDMTHGNRSSPSLRLRSRRSRLRLEKRIAESGGSPCSTQECQNQTEENSTEPVKEGVKIVDESEDLILVSQPLLLPHWNSQGERVDARKKEDQLKEDLLNQRELENSHIIFEAQNKVSQLGTSQVEEEKDQNKDENVPQSNKEAKPEQRVMGKEQGESLLDSCTLVEGLLFPAEYYIRTTRRMSLSHSQPDLQAVIHSQLSMGRPRRSRGSRGSVSLASKNTQTESLVSANESEKDVLDADTSTEVSGNTPDSGESKTDRFPSPSVCNSRRGKRKRGRARRKPSSSRYPSQRNVSQRNPDQSSNETSTNPLSSASSSLGPNTLRSVIVSQEVAMDDAHSRGSPSTVVDAVTRPIEKVYPIFLKSSSQNSTSKTPNVESLKPLCLLFPPSTESSVIPLPSLLPQTLLDNMRNLDLQQDFYLPDDQFASLKLQKLKQVSLGLAVEDFVSSYASSPSRDPLSDPKSLLPLPSTLTPPVSFGPHLSVNKCSDETGEEMNVRFGGCSVLGDTRSMVLEDPGKQMNRYLDLDCFERSEAAADCSLTGLQFPLKYENKVADLDLQEPSWTSEEEPAVKGLRPLQNTQLLLSPSLAPPPLSPVPNSGPVLPSLGITPLQDIPLALLTSSPAPPMLTLPSPHSPSTLALSPPTLSPSCLSPVRITIEPQGEPRDQEEVKTLTLKAPAGAPLVDVCCPVLSDGRVHVAAAGKHTVYLWSLTSLTDWTLTHTWTLSKPVISVLPVPDSDGLLCVTLGELEIREVRMLSCVRLADVLLCAGLVDTVVTVSESRLVSSSPGGFGSTLQVFTLCDDDRPQRTEALMSPGVCVRGLATVDGLPDALIGCDEAVHLFIWNLRTGQLLQRIVLEDGLSHAACIRGYAKTGLLLVLLQHDSLSCVERDKEENAVFSLLAINPLSGKSALVSSLYPPKTWFGSLCDADVGGSRVAGLSRSGCVCVWELPQTTAQMVTSPGLDGGWSVARWGGDALITAQHSGDITLHFSL